MHLQFEDEKIHLFYIYSISALQRKIFTLGLYESKYNIVQWFPYRKPIWIVCKNTYSSHVTWFWKIFVWNVKTHPSMMKTMSLSNLHVNVPKEYLITCFCTWNSCGLSVRVPTDFVTFKMAYIVNRDRDWVFYIVSDKYKESEKHTLDVLYNAYHI